MAALLNRFWVEHGRQIGNIIFIIVVITIVINIVERIKQKKRATQTLSQTFMFTIIKGIFIVIGIFQVGNQFENFKNISQAIILSSSLLIAVLGFAFQRSLEDLIAGMMITIFHPFEIGERVKLMEIDITGYIEDITIRHTVLRTFQNSRLIIPNSVMNKEIIENAHMVDKKSSGFIDFQIDYKSDIKRATEIITQAIINNPRVIDMRTPIAKEQNEPQVTVYMNRTNGSIVNLRASVWTETVDENFDACSEVRTEVVEKFKEEGIKLEVEKLYLTNS